MEKSNIIAFALGLLVGSGATYLYFKNQYEVVKEIEVPEESDDENSNNKSEEEISNILNYAKNKPPITEFMVSDSLSEPYQKPTYFDYTKMYNGQSADDVRAEEESESDTEMPEQNDISENAVTPPDGVERIDASVFYSDGNEHYTFYKHPNGEFMDDNYETYDLDDFTGIDGFTVYVSEFLDDAAENFYSIERADTDICIIKASPGKSGS